MRHLAAACRHAEPLVSGALDDFAAVFDLAYVLDKEVVLAGGFAVRHHGYVRETDGVDIVVPTGAARDSIVEAAESLGFEIRAKHGFGGVDLRAPNGLRIDVLYGRSARLASICSGAVYEAVAQGRMTEVLGETACVVGLPHLIAMKLVAERMKDKADVVELVKAQVRGGRWTYRERSAVRDAVRHYLGTALAFDRLAEAAEEELRRGA